MLTLVVEEGKNERDADQEQIITPVLKSFDLNEVRDGSSIKGHTQPQVQVENGHSHQVSSTHVKSGMAEETDHHVVMHGTNGGRYLDAFYKQHSKSTKSVTYDMPDASLDENETKHKTKRPSSAILRARRRENEQKEDRLRGLINSVSSSYSGDDHSVSSNGTFNTVETSLLSHGRNLSRGKNIKWESVHVYISFGLLTTSQEAPKEGVFDTVEASVQDKLLTSIVSKMKALSKAAIEQDTGNILMKCQDPFITSVQRDEKFSQADRPGVVRSIVKTTIPLKLTDVHEELNNTSKIVAKIMVRQALIDGVHKGFFISE